MIICYHDNYILVQATRINQGILSRRDGKTSSTSGIDTEGEARGTIPDGNEVLPKRRDKEHRFHLLRLRYYGRATQKQVTNTEIPCFLSIFHVNNDYLTTEMATKNGILKTRNRISNSLEIDDILIFLSLQPSKFVPRHVGLYRFGFLKIERERTFTAGKNRCYPGKNRTEKVEPMINKERKSYFRPKNTFHQVWSWLHASTFAEICARGRKCRLRKFPKMENLGKSTKNGESKLF